MMSSINRTHLTRNPEFDSGHFFVRKVPLMVEEARAVSASLSREERQARNWRGVLVDVSVFAVNPTTGETETFTAPNTKPTRKTDKVCAEKRGLRKASKMGATEVVGMVIAASTKKDENEGILDVATHNLWPCRECRNEFAEHPLIREDTAIVTVKHELDNYQVATYGEMRDLFARADEEMPHGLESMPANFGFEMWDRRVELYDDLSVAEMSLPEEARRPIGQLIQMALRSKVTAR